VVGNLTEYRAKSDRFASACKAAKRRPGVAEIFLPGERGWRSRQRGDDVALLPSHWQAFNGFLGEEGLDVDALRGDWEAA
jgi:LDH2 family malate/lactate/ureidoglycolate dehydrogenase